MEEWYVSPGGDYAKLGLAPGQVRYRNPWYNPEQGKIVSDLVHYIRSELPWHQGMSSEERQRLEKWGTFMEIRDAVRLGMVDAASQFAAAAGGVPFVPPVPSE